MNGALFSHERPQFLNAMMFAYPLIGKGMLSSIIVQNITKQLIQMSVVLKSNVNIFLHLFCMRGIPSKINNTLQADGSVSDGNTLLSVTIFHPLLESLTLDSALASALALALASFLAFAFSSNLMSSGSFVFLLSFPFQFLCGLHLL